MPVRVKKMNWVDYAMGCLFSALLISGCVNVPQSSREQQVRSWIEQENTAYALYDDGKLSEAVNKYTEAVNTARDKNLGIRYEALSLSDLAQVCLSMKDYNHAQALYQKAADLYQQYTEKSPEFEVIRKLEMARTVASLASLYQLSGKTDEADNLYQRALSIVPASKQNQGDSIEQGRAAILQKYAKFLGDKSTAGSSAELDRKIEAVANELAQIATTQGVLPGSNQESILKKNIDGANDAFYHGKPDQAQALLLSAVSYAKSRPETDEDVMANLDSLAQCCFRLDDWPDAEFFYRRLYSCKAKEFGSNSPEAVSALNNTAQSCYGQHKCEEAEAMWMRCLDLQSKRKGISPSEVATTMLRISDTYECRRMYKDSTAILERAIKILELSGAKDAPLHAHLMYVLGLNLAGTNEDNKEAESCARRAVKELEATDGKDALSVADALMSLGDIHFSMAMIDRCRQEYLQAMRIRKLHSADDGGLCLKRLEMVESRATQLHKSHSSPRRM